MNYFEFVISSADYGIRKPHRLIFLAAVQKLREPIGDIWFIGDTFESDISGALDVGLFAVWYNKSQESPVNTIPNAILHGWRDLLELLR